MRPSRRTEGCIASSGSREMADAAPDATIETEPDAAGSTGSVDAAIEAATPAPPDAGPEAGVAEAAVEAATDAGPPDAGAVAIDTTDTQVIAVSSGATLFINDAHNVWTYGAATQVSDANLPSELAGTVGNDTVNTSTPVTFTLSATTTCYLIRQDDWTAVDLTGWVAIHHAPYYFTGYDNNGYGPATLYSQTFAPGVYEWSTYSAMYACAE